MASRQPSPGSTASTEQNTSRLPYFASAVSKAAINTQGEQAQSRETYPEQDLDKGIVGWHGQDDPENPRNYPPSRKWVLLGLISAITLISPFASSIFAPAVSFMDEEFGNKSSTRSTLAVTVYVCGYAVGPLFFSPLSEIFGRRLILNIATSIFVLFQVGCALAPNISALIVFRLVTGIGGSACLTIGGGVVADLFEKEQRGLAMAFFSAGPLFGPVLGPLCGGFIAEGASWRWVFWVLLIAGGTFVTCIMILNRETNPTVLMRHKTKRLGQELNRDDLRSCYDHLIDGKPRTASNILLHGLARPIKMLFTSPIVSLLAFYVAFVYGLLYLLFTTVTVVFQNTYHWKIELCGLAYIGLGTGFILGQAIFGLYSDRIIVRLTNANNGIYEPEMRLTLCFFFACFIPVSFFWYGWSAQAHAHWIVPIIGLMPFGFGMIGLFVSIQTYIVDAFPEYAASGIAAMTVCRSVFGAFLPLAGPAMYSKLKYGWGNSLLGFIALALVPVPIFVNRYGGVIRKKYPVSLD
ncbi:hypothetical protein VE00_07918 [Pseudogymnoascus sp. WSF 3629]|nr:hypothetical protein VE00_07918 [Pseudogymnoascus sp. WSF 3629]